MSKAAEALQRGRPWPIGATVRDGGVNFAVFSAHAERIELCLFDESGGIELSRAPLPGRSGDVWHGFLPAAGAGLVYGLRAHGAWSPREGLRFNPNKLLLDPWSREIVGNFAWRDEHFGHVSGDPDRMDSRDSAPYALKSRVVDDAIDWQGDAAPHTALDDTVIYEVHVRGFTRQHPGVPANLRGSYAGLASDAAIAHLRALGVTAVCLLPVQQHLDEERLHSLGLNNYWGYNTVGFFCPEPRYAASAGGPAVRDEFRAMVRRLHAAGLEVILDVVYNHTAETDEFGPHLAWRGLDDRNWYRHAGDGSYENLSGCGNALDLRQPRVLQMVLDSLRYWVQEMHVDGFRFDLAPVLGRSGHGFQRDHAFFIALAQDPTLSKVKLIAEPWDLGRGGYRLGDFPAGWLEWNDRFRDTMRAFWLGHASSRGEFAQRLCGSSDIFRGRGRSPAESVNYAVAHDGFTLADLVSHSHRHNEANGEHNRDGHAHNLACNFGIEGPTDNPAVRQRRARAQRALLACTILAQGTPMLAAGAEIGHSQGGNNNAYCQDNPTTWLDWANADGGLMAFTSHVVGIRRALRPLDGRWYDGSRGPDGHADLAWRRPDGGELSASDWQDVHERGLLVLVGVPGVPGLPQVLLVNANAHDLEFRLPPGRWSVILDTASDVSGPGWVVHGRHATSACSLVLLQQLT
jgi:glycogen debranching enzyme GlgX